MADFAQKEIQRRLSLYQVFLKLYEHHSSLLDEILQLENVYQPSLERVKPCYVNGVVDTTAVYLITNLCENETQTLRQPQQIWTIGRDRSSGIRIADSYLSRRHAAIQFIDQGFYLVDFNSTNGSFVNGERVYQPLKLKDGDRIKLGSMTFNFFINHTYRILPTVAMELLMQLVPRIGSNSVEISTYIRNRQQPMPENPDDTLAIANDSNLYGKLEHWHNALNAEQKSEILDRFLSRQTPYNPK
ncbi:MAG: FHA domain-containing protein [Komarekiella atlantica HA4396-MV6]|jgi:pSer/pThr/pTyr-binding forkhead associated (FHA) protein|nr:FHA domain-containing protein [Komarekiella atlantica HA4396-MV6]